MLCVKWQYVSFFFLLVTSQTDNVKLQQRQDIGARLELHIGLKTYCLLHTRHIPRKIYTDMLTLLDVNSEGETRREQKKK